jgi:small-conductance mechanosensitive channel
MNSNTFPFSLYALIDFEIYIFLLIFTFISYLFYKLLLKNASPERHTNITNHLKNLLLHAALLSFFYFIFNLLSSAESDLLIIKKALPYLSTLTYLWGCLLFVKTARLLVLQYLFLGSMRAGVPVLLVNIFSLLLSIALLFWSVSKVFGVQLTPLLATSAAFSIVLGLALQDTLGNLFAGISLQMDKTFEIDDWLEVQNGTVKVTGQVKELTWRSTLLIGYSDEKITLPNKLIASAQVSNFSPENQPIVRSQVFKVLHTADTQKVKDLLFKAVQQVPEVKLQPEPFPFIQEVTENWITIKIIYYLDHFGKQFSTGDHVLEKCLHILKENQIQIAHQVIDINSLSQNNPQKSES